jgi:hypothetical protein
LRTQTKTLLIAAAILMAVVSTSAKTTKMTGKMVAYDVMKHASKSSSILQNEEVIVLETNSQKAKDKYVKVMFSTAGTTQIEQKYFDGTQAFQVETFRDHTCDEKSPQFVNQVSMEQISGTYLLTDAFKTTPPGKIKILECYVAIQRTKK